jgi:hypothetical protein
MRFLINTVEKTERICYWYTYKIKQIWKEVVYTKNEWSSKGYQRGGK